eukprot:CAMPEP_0119059598 /NCGR_PEP_ID=MMETSP1178-20130426/3704_1 /TAXON_ID=33656 /ORGANISM="unid sp, Strain CCMP2000" /LENGTH=354 /DNA_ID=CAMNT_0007040641 /DNA_START=54 /DNA_END=1118 /DNA_ORIENTATION=-
MACCMGGGGDDVDPEIKKIDEQARKELLKARSEDDRVIKMLLLGAGESGKSTIFKQMKIINQSGYTSEERAAHASIVQSNAVTSMQMLLDGIEKCHIDKPADLVALQAQFTEVFADTETLTPESGELVGRMWAHAAVQQAFGRKNEFQLHDSASYLLNELGRISAPGYVPTEQDVLRSRVRTTGIVRSDFKIKRVNFSMFDVGGQRNERRKWIHAFDNCNAVVFVAALSEYDQVLYEDDGTNRMEESLSLFEQICNSKWFTETSVILFLNKQDLFIQKLATQPLSKYMEDYKGLNEFEPAVDFIKGKFLDRRKDTEKRVYVHATCATDTSNVRFVFDSVVSIILEDNMKASGLF